MNIKFIYSESLEKWIIGKFKYCDVWYVWNDFDCIYYSEDSDENYFVSLPNYITDILKSSMEV